MDIDQAPLPIIDRRRCNGCGNCAALCPTRAVEVIGGRAEIVRPQACTFCEICETYCPEGAIGRPFKIVFAPSITRGPLDGDITMQRLALSQNREL